jgi:hypothetical protein
MMEVLMRLNIGVYDIPYAAKFTRRSYPKTGKGSRPRIESRARAGYGANSTTGKVAQILEDKYGLFSAFYEMDKKNIIADLEKSMLGAISNVLAGRPAPIDLTAEATSAITARFKAALAERTLETAPTIRGVVPTGAAKKGISHCFANPYQLVQRPHRPSWIDTGTLQSALVVWTDK